jgi:iron complex transport system ATP-binding protein
MTISADQLCLTLGERPVLKDVTVTLERGQVIAVLGPNGAGKTSLLRTMAGLVTPQSGSIMLDGRNLSDIPLAERALRIGYLPQNGTPAWNVTARELVGLGRLPHRHRFAGPSAIDHALIDAALKATDTVHLAARTLNEMSGGERARVKFARILAGNPDWILADEPLANLDPPHHRDVLALLRAAARQGAGVVVVLHGLNAAARVADQIVLMRGGCLVAQGKTADVLTPDLLAHTYDMAFEVIEHAGSAVVVPQG